MWELWAKLIGVVGNGRRREERGRCATDFRRRWGLRWFCLPTRPLLDWGWRGEGGRAACSAWQESQLHRSLPVMRERTGCHIKGPGGESVHGMEGFCQLKSRLHLFLYNHFMNLCHKWTVLVSGVVKYLTRKNSKEEGLLCSQSKQLSIVHHGGTAGSSASTLAGV